MHTRDEFIQGLRDLADWLEATPEAKLSEWSTCRVDHWSDNKDDVVELAKVGGHMKKHYYGESFDLRKSFGPVSYEMTIPRDQVCTKVVVGTKKVVKVDPEAYKALPKIEVDEDEVEWKCHPLLETDDTIG